MSKAHKVISKLLIESYKDELYTSLIGKFNASINPENLLIKSSICYQTQHIGTKNLLHYESAAPRLLSFSLLFDHTGIIPGSNDIGVTTQLDALDGLFYDQKTRLPRFVRVIWGEIDFKGRLRSKEVAYTMFQIDGTLARTEVSLVLIEQLSAFKKGASDRGKDIDSAIPSAAVGGGHIDARPDADDGSHQTFRESPDGPGAYQGAPKGAYEGAPDEPYQGQPNTSTSETSTISTSAGLDQRGGMQTTGVPSGQSTAPSTNASHDGSSSYRTDTETSPAISQAQDPGGGRQPSTPNHGASSSATGKPNELEHGTSTGEGQSTYPTSSHGSFTSSSYQGSAYGAGHVAHSSHNRKKRGKLDLSGLSANVNGDTLKEGATEIKDVVEKKLSFWQRAKLFATKVMVKYT